MTLLHQIFAEVFGSPLQTVGTLLGIANTILLIRRSIWNWPVGIASVAILGVVFFRTYLLSDMLLQIYFIVMQAIGWVAWLRHREPDGDLIVETMTPREVLLALLGTGAFALALGATMGHFFHAAFPYWDATVASASVVGQLLLTWRRMENWLWWIGSNLISIVIYSVKDLHILAGLYLFYMLMSVFGYVEWRRKLAMQENSQLSAQSSPL
jgi:nicotinamide mononucleotide transporter